PSIRIRGITATSGRHWRSCEGWIVVQASHHPSSSPASSSSGQPRRERHSAHAANTANDAAARARTPGHGSGAYPTASTVQATSAAAAIHTSQRSGRERRAASHADDLVSPKPSIQHSRSDRPAGASYNGGDYTGAPSHPAPNCP